MRKMSVGTNPDPEFSTINSGRFRSRIDFLKQPNPAKVNKFEDMLAVGSPLTTERTNT